MLRDAPGFYNAIRAGKLLGPTLTTAEFQGLDNILNACNTAKWGVAWTAYALATAYHETAHTMQPIKEYGGNAYFTRMYDVRGNRPEMARAHGNLNPGDGIKYCGRGFVMLTWYINYLKASKVTGVDLVKYPDRAMEIAIASHIMISGMQEGWFTGKKLADYLPASGPASRDGFIGCRRVINGTDKASMIADYAQVFQADLINHGWC